MTCSLSCARPNPARPLLGLFVRSLSIRRSAARGAPLARAIHSPNFRVVWRETRMAKGQTARLGRDPERMARPTRSALARLGMRWMWEADRRA
jgi:hypothetical protein